MIKTEHGSLEAKGTLAEIKADLSTIVNGIYNKVLLEEMSEEEAKEFVFDAVNRGFKTKDEIDKEIKDKIVTSLADLIEKLEKFLKEEGEE